MAQGAETTGKMGAGVPMPRGHSALRRMSAGRVTTGVGFPCGVPPPLEITSSRPACWKRERMLTRATPTVFHRCLRQCGEDTGMLLSSFSGMARVKLLGRGRLGRVKSSPVAEPRDMTDLLQL